MVKRICIIFPDQSLTIMSNVKGEGSALHQAHFEAKIHNKGERDESRKAQVGEIEIDLTSFKQRC